MKHHTEMGAALACMTALLAGGCSTETAPPEPTPSASSIVPSPEYPSPSSKPAPTPDTMIEACSDDIVKEALNNEYDPALEPLVDRLQDKPDAQLQLLAQGTLGKLATVTLLANEISRNFGDTSGSAAIEVLNDAQPEQGFSHVVDVANDSITMQDWAVTSGGNLCNISSLNRQVVSGDGISILTFKRGETAYTYNVTEDGFVLTHDGTPMSARDVGVMATIADRYFRIVDSAANNPNTFNYAPEPPTQTEGIEA